MTDTLFGFGCMRLPLIDDNSINVDQELFNEMVDYYMDKGFNYFDTSYAYHNGYSETAIKKALVERYPRESFRIADKIPTWLLKEYDDNEKYVNVMLERLQIDYFDRLLIHNVNESWGKLAFTHKSFDYLVKAKREGKAKQIGFSFHGLPELLEDTLKTYADDIDFVQLEINFLDWEDPVLQAKKCYEICCNYGLDVYVMEPIKGGALLSASEEIRKDFEEFDSDKSMASFALRFCASLENVKVVLSGMHKMEDVIDNCNTFENFEALSNDELAFLEEEASKFRDAIEIPCSSCDYCVEHCPKNIAIPEYFNLYNNYKQSPDSHLAKVYYDNIASQKSRASECIECGVCIDYCTQKINIPEELKKVSRQFDA